MNINWMRLSFGLLLVTFAIALFADVASAAGDDNDLTVTASAKLGAGIALAGCGIGT